MDVIEYTKMNRKTHDNSGGVNSELKLMRSISDFQSFKQITEDINVQNTQKKEYAKEELETLKLFKQISANQNNLADKKSKFSSPASRNINNLHQKIKLGKWDNSNVENRTKAVLKFESSGLEDLDLKKIQSMQLVKRSKPNFLEDELADIHGHKTSQKKLKRR